MVRIGLVAGILGLWLATSATAMASVGPLDTSSFHQIVATTQLDDPGASHVTLVAHRGCYYGPPAFHYYRGGFYRPYYRPYDRPYYYPGYWDYYYTPRFGLYITF